MEKRVSSQPSRLLCVCVAIAVFECSAQEMKQPQADIVTLRSSHDLVLRRVYDLLPQPVFRFTYILDSKLSLDNISTSYLVTACTTSFDPYCHTLPLPLHLTPDIVTGKHTPPRASVFPGERPSEQSSPTGQHGASTEREASQGEINR